MGIEIVDFHNDWIGVPNNMHGWTFISSQLHKLLFMCDTMPIASTMQLQSQYPIMPWLDLYVKIAETQQSIQQKPIIAAQFN